MFRLLLASLLMAFFALTGCGKGEPKEVKSIRPMENLKKLPKNK
jgi:hypothetical protein